jgi:hypothetical protein
MGASELSGEVVPGLEECFAIWLGEDPLTPSLSPPYPLADMAILYGKLAASAPWRAGNSKMARVQERALASLLGEGQDEGVFVGMLDEQYSGCHEPE